MTNDIFGPFTLVSFGVDAPQVREQYETLEDAKAAVAALKIPDGARVLIMGNRRTSFGSMRMPVA